MRRSRTNLALLALLLVALPALAQPDADLAAQDERDLKLSHWKWMQELKLPADAPGPYLALPIAPAVFGQTPARMNGKGLPEFDDKMPNRFPDQPPIDPRDLAPGDLRDLRIADASGKRIPYVLRVMRRRVEQRDVPFTKVDQGWSDKSRTYQWLVELNPDAMQGHNEIEVHTTGNDFRRRVVIEGAMTNQFEEPRTVVDEKLVRFNVDGRLVEVHRFRYDLKNFRHLRVRVHADPTLTNDMPKITHVFVRRSIVQEGEFATDEAKLGPMEFVRGQGGPGSAWMIEFPSRMPCEKLSFVVKGAASDRPMRLQVADRGDPRFDIGISEWSWRKEGDHAILHVHFNEVIAQRLRLIVTDFANPPLAFDNVKATRCVRKLIIEKAEADKAVPPLRLYIGNTNVGPANYDLAQKLPARFDAPPALVEAGSVVPNPSYEPPPRTLHERAPWLVYVVLGVACAVLLVILSLLARQAIRRHDSAAKPVASAA